MEEFVETEQSKVFEDVQLFDHMLEGHDHYDPWGVEQMAYFQTILRKMADAKPEHLLEALKYQTFYEYYEHEITGEETQFSRRAQAWNDMMTLHQMDEDQYYYETEGETR